MRAVVLVACVLLAAACATPATPFDPESPRLRPFADRVAQAVVDRDVGQVQESLLPSARATLTPANIEKVFRFVDQGVGRLADPRYQSRVRGFHIAPGEGRIETVIFTYEVDAEKLKRKTLLRVTVTETGGRPYLVSWIVTMPWAGPAPGNPSPPR